MCFLLQHNTSLDMIRPRIPSAEHLSELCCNNMSSRSVTGRNCHSETFKTTLYHSVPLSVPCVWVWLEDSPLLQILNFRLRFASEKGRRGEGLGWSQYLISYRGTSDPSVKLIPLTRVQHVPSATCSEITTTQPVFVSMLSSKVSNTLKHRRSYARTSKRSITLYILCIYIHTYAVWYHSSCSSEHLYWLLCVKCLFQPRQGNNGVRCARNTCRLEKTNTRAAPAAVMPQVNRVPNRAWVTLL